MSVLIAIALKSLLIAGVTLGLLALMKHRSAAERSWVAHIGLLALVIMAFAPLVLPRWNVEAPAAFAQSAEPVNAQSAAIVDERIAAAVRAKRPGQVAPVEAPAAVPTISAGATATAFYAVPAAVLLFVTLLALARLFALRARADVLVDGHWLSALARAQRRMGFKHGTALLTSNELASPISWGVMRPVILLNSRAVEAAEEAEAIIAHELAHVAHVDWVKLLLARVATALFWFNPLVWMLAREAHQLREETADDTVLAADIPDTDYAQLLVGVARHECPGMLLGAHGVAPSKSSLARRVARVLDGRSVRGPVGRSFALGVLAGAAVVATPLAALTVRPKQAETPATAKKARVEHYYGAQDSVPADLPSIISTGVSTSVQTAMAAVHPSVVVNRNAVVATVPGGATAISYQDAGGDEAAPEPVAVARSSSHRAIENAIAMKAVGVTPEYVAAMRASAPQLRDIAASDLVGLKAIGVTPQFVREIAASGLRQFDADDLAGARAVGVDGVFVRDMVAAGMRNADLGDLTGARAVGVTPAYISELRAAGISDFDLGDVTGARAVGVTGAYIREMRARGYDGDLGDFTSLRGVSEGGGEWRVKPHKPPKPPRI